MSATGYCPNCLTPTGSDLCAKCGASVVAFEEAFPFTPPRGPRYADLCTHEGTTTTYEQVTCDPRTVTLCIRCGRTV